MDDEDVFTTEMIDRAVELMEKQSPLYVCTICEKPITSGYLVWIPGEDSFRPLCICEVKELAEEHLNLIIPALLKERCRAASSPSPTEGTSVSDGASIDAIPGADEPNE